MDFDLPSLQFLFKISQKLGIAQNKIQEVVMDLSEHIHESPLDVSFIEEKLVELSLIAKYLSKFDEL